MKKKELRPIKESPSSYDQLEAVILESFRKEIYLPIMKQLKMATPKVQNAKISALKQAIQKGQITFYRGEFIGQLSAEVTKELRALGAKWDRASGSFKMPASAVPQEVKSWVAVSETKFDDMAAKIDSQLASISPGSITPNVKMEAIFDKTLWQLNKDIKKTLKGLTVSTDLTPEGLNRISQEYTNNLDLYIQKFTDQQIKKLRADVQESTFAGNRYESMIKSIEKSYGVTQRKAKFLARQETGILMSKFKKERYQSAGVNEYKWGCVSGSPNHPVRPMHKELEGKVFSWDQPPITDDLGNRNNPGEDYNCRCFARPIVNFDE